VAAPAPASACRMLAIHIWGVDICIAVERLRRIRDASRAQSYTRSAMARTSAGRKGGAKMNVQVCDTALDVAHALHELRHGHVTMHIVMHIVGEIFLILF